MSYSQDNLLDFEYNIPGADILDQSANLGGEPMEEEVVVLEEVQVLPEPAVPAEPEEDPGYMLACGDRDIFDEDASSLYTASQLVRDLSSPTQEDPGVPACSQVVAEILKNIPKPENLNWAAKMDAYNTEEQRTNGPLSPFSIS